MSKIFLYAKIARVQTLLMTISLILCSFLYVKYNYKAHFNFPFLCISLSIIFFHLAVNTISEYRDCIKGVDDIHSSGTKFRLITGLVPYKNIYYLGIGSFFIASIIGIIALFYGTVFLIIPGLIAAGIVYFYSENPIGLKYRAFGEICVFLGYGPLLFSACILSLTNNLHCQDLMFSVPFGLLTTCVLLANNIRDYEFEKGKTVTLTIKYGLKFSYFLLFFMVNLSFFFIPYLVFQNNMSFYSFWVFLIYPLIFFSIKKIGKPDFINIFGILQVTFTSIICISFLIEILLKS